MNLMTTFNIIVPVSCGDYNRNDLAHVGQYFTNTPVKRSAQLDGSPLVDEKNSPIKACFELQQTQRKNIGIHANERHTYTLVKGQLDFQLRKIKLWIFNTNIAFFTVEVHANEMDKDKVLDLVAELCNIKLNRKIDYVYNINKDITEIKTFTLKELIINLLTLQNVIPLKEIREETFQKAHCLFYGFNAIENKEELSLFLEMLRCQNKSDRITSSGLSSENKYEPATYITWAISENVMAAIGNTYSTSPDNERFIVEPGGFVQTIFSNYIAVYLNCLSVYLRLRAISRDYNIFDVSALSTAPDKAICELHNLLNTPFNDLTNERHINELFRDYLCRNVLGLQEQIQKLSGGETLKYIKETYDKITAIDNKVDEINDSLKEIENWIKSISTVIEEQKSEQLQSAAGMSAEQFESICSEFINETAQKIAEIACKDTASVDYEEAQLQGMFGEHWLSLNAYTRKSLTSAKVFIANCNRTSYSVLDYSGIIVSATSAFENELKRRFFTGYQKFLTTNYGSPADGNWPESMVFYNKQGKAIKNNNFTLGSLPYIFDCAGDDADKLNEYMNIILDDVHKSQGINALTSKDSTGKSFIDKCDDVRFNYRNAAAHTEPVSRAKAEACCNDIIGSNDAAKKIGQVQGLLLELVNLTSNYK